MSAKQYPSPPDRFWQGLVDAETPSIAEMAAEERELRELEAAGRGRREVAQLPATVVDDLVANAIRPAAQRAFVARLVTGGGGLQRRLLLSALLVVSVASAAWMGLLWASQENAPQTLSYEMAVELATERNRNDEAYRSAIGIIVENCGGAAGVLRQLSSAPEPSLANQAKAIAGGLIALLTNGRAQVIGPISAPIIDSALLALDSKEPLDVRERALAQLGSDAASGLSAMLLSPLAGAEANLNRQLWIDELLERLRE